MMFTPLRVWFKRLTVIDLVDYSSTDAVGITGNSLIFIKAPLQPATENSTGFHGDSNLNPQNMRPIPRVTLAVITLCITFVRSSPAQSSDDPKYFILYDISGSTSFIDKKGNLGQLLYRTIGEHPYGMKNINSFEIFFFGADTSQLVSTSFDLPSLKTRAAYDSQKATILSTIEAQNGPDKRHNQYSHIHAAIEAIEPSLHQISGLFIFTDGSLLQGDIDPALGKTLAQYRNTVASKLQMIRDAGIPVFLIQTSDARTNPYFIFPNGNSLDSRHLLSGDDFFWVYNEVSSDSLTKVVDSFDEFMSAAHNKIMRTQFMSGAAPDDPVSTMVALHQIEVLANKFDIADLTTSPLLTSVDPAVKTETQKLRTKLSQASLSLAEANSAKASIDRLAANEVEVNKMLFALSNAARTSHMFTANVAEAMNIRKSGVSETKIQSEAASLLTTDLEKKVIQGLTNYVIKRAEQEALFFLFENIDATMTRMNPYFKEVLFKNTYTFITNYNKHQDLLLVKEAFHKDIDSFHDNLLLYPAARESEALVALALVYQAISSIQSKRTLEETFDDIHELTDRWVKAGPAKTRMEKGIMLMSHLVAILKKYNLTGSQHKLTPEQIRFFAREVIVYYGIRYGDFTEMKLDNIEEHVASLYKHFHRTRERITYMQTSFNTTTGDYNEWQQMKKDILLDVLKEVSSLIVSSIELANEFRKATETDAQLIAKVAEGRQHAESMVESWFLIREGEYVAAAVSLMPVITSVINANPDLKNYLKGTLSEQESALNKRKASINRQLVKWNMGALDQLETKFTAVRTKIEAWNKQHLTLADFKRNLAQVDLTELEILIDSANTIPTDVLNALAAFLDGAQEAMDIYKLRDLNIKYDISAAFAFRYLIFTELNEKAQNLISIAAEVSTSVEADDITNVLLKYGMPPASYRVKRQQNAALMINAYAGIGSSFHSNRYINIAAPMGLELSFRTKNRKTSVSILATPIDLGNTINYELLGDDDADDDEVFRWSNIYSPGGFVVIGISKNHPFSVGLGYQGNPDRFSAFIALDLPVFRLR